MKIGRWFKKAVCLLLVWGLILAAAGGTPVSYAQEITVSVDETKLEEQTVLFTKSFTGRFNQYGSCLFAGALRFIAVSQG